MTNPTDAYRDEMIQKSQQKETVGHALATVTECSHTPGAWKLCHHLQSPEKDASCPCGYRGGIWGSDGEHIVCEMGSQPTPGQEGMEPPRYPRPVELANARLIAAAPDLLVALARLASDKPMAFLHSLEVDVRMEFARTVLLAAGLGQKPSPSSRDDSFCDPSLNNSIPVRGGA